jgi:hypothetical protein
VIDDATYLYVLNELTNTLIGYAVSYNYGSISFEEIYQSSIYGEGEPVPAGVTSAEILVTVSSVVGEGKKMQ